MGLFRPDGIIYSLMTKFSNMVLLSLCWLICSLPVVTIGASTTALYAVCLKMHDDDDAHVARRFFGYFKSNFRHATLVWIPLMIVGGMLLWSSYLYFFGIPQMPGISGILLAVLVIASAIYLICMTYVFACVARYENTPLQSIKNAVFIGLRYIGRTLIIAAITLAILFVVMWNYTTMLLGLIFVPAFLCYVNCSFIKRIFGELEERRNNIDTAPNN